MTLPLGDLKTPCPEPICGLVSCYQDKLKNGPPYVLRSADCYNQVKTLFRDREKAPL